MVSPRQMAEYTGFTESEVKHLCGEHSIHLKICSDGTMGIFSKRSDMCIVLIQ